MKNEYEIRGDVTAIVVFHKKVRYETIIDTVDLPLAQEFPNTWEVHFDRSSIPYIRGRMTVHGRRVLVLLHRHLLHVTNALVVDHINHDTLDNRRSTNLRTVTRGQNRQNIRGAYKSNLSGHRGVTWYESRGQWRARGGVGKKMYHLGYYDTVEEAIAVVKKWRVENMPFSQEAEISRKY